MGWEVLAAFGQVVDVVDFQDRVAYVGQVLDVAGAAGVLTVALAAEHDGQPRLLVANRDGCSPGGPFVIKVLPVDVSLPAEL